MISDMYSIMKRINAIKKRFGLDNSSFAGTQQTKKSSGLSFEAMRKTAIDKVNQNVETKIAVTNTLKTSNVNTASLYSQNNRIAASLLQSVLNPKGDINSISGSGGLSRLSNILGNRKVSTENVINTITADSNEFNQGKTSRVNDAVRAYNSNKTFDISGSGSEFSSK